jgi:hypothetical protein
MLFLVVSTPRPERPSELAGIIRKVDGDGLPLWGNGLRHYKTLAVTMKPSVEEILTDFLQGHTPKGVSRKYASVMAVAKSDPMREAQERISERTLSLLGLTAADFA